jgi:hypothetical protein
MRWARTLGTRRIARCAGGPGTLPPADPLTQTSRTGLTLLPNLRTLPVRARLFTAMHKLP